MTQHSGSPFTPGYGKKPLVFGGHETDLAELRAVFTTMDFGENHSVLVSGLRGAGKTSFLAELEDAAYEAGWIVISDNASAGLMDRLMDTTIPAEINRLAPRAGVRLAGLGVWQLNAQFEYVDRQREVKPQLRRDLVALSRALAGDAGILITIDEVSSGKVRLRELSKIALEVSHALKDGANVMVVFAGIQVSLEDLLEQEHTTFLRRSREVQFQRLSAPTTAQVLTDTAAIGGRTFEPAGLTLLVSISQGYPYLVQLAGDYAWRNNPEAPTITEADAESAHARAVQAIESRVISRVYSDLSEKDREFLHAMAQDDDRSKIADIVVRMGQSDQYVQVYKNRLIKTGYVQSAGHGYVEFSLPYLGAYVRRQLAGDGDDQPRSDDGWDEYPAPPLP
ncbi:ATP-binding protein [uncultured Demequina sp.]|uniref:ATP-binding protein n=1 Tax=uncultured Demequina sp. TaxID=693499 RepID=UPI0025E1E055|nr:ATP-binding protein [uncultured Demequina sp.]